MSVYQRQLKLVSSDTDAFRRLRLTALFTMLQEAAIAHTTELGMGREKTLDKGLLWVITMQQLSIDRLPRYDESVKLLTWPGKMMHIYFPRYFRLASEDGAQLLSGSMLWCLIDAESRSFIFPEEHGIFIDGADEKSPLDLPKRPVMPELSDAGRFTVPFSFTDLNGHMNNTRYYDLASDRISPALREKELCEIRTEYSGEAREGDVLQLRSFEDASAFYLEGSRMQENGSDGKKSEGARCFRIALTFR